MVIRKCADGQHLPSLAWNVDGGKASVAATATATTTTTTIGEGSKQNMLPINSIWRAMCEACSAFVYCHLLILQACKYARQWAEKYDEGQGREGELLPLPLLLLTKQHQSPSLAQQTMLETGQDASRKLCSLKSNQREREKKLLAFLLVCFISNLFRFTYISFHSLLFGIFSAFSRQFLAQLLANSVAVRLECIYS